MWVWLGIEGLSLPLGDESIISLLSLRRDDDPLPNSNCSAAVFDLDDPPVAAFTPVNDTLVGCWCVLEWELELGVELEPEPCGLAA